MGWNKLLGSIYTELNEGSPIIKKTKEIVLFERIAKEVLGENALDEADLKAAGQKVVSTAKEVGQKVKRAWEILAGKIKEVATFGFRFGVAVGKTVANKFVLFNKQGKILTPEAEKASIEKVGKKQFLTLTFKTPKFEIPMNISDKMNMAVGTAVLGEGLGFMYVAQPKAAAIKEGVDYTLDLVEQEEPYDPEEEMMKLRQVVMKGFRDPAVRQALVNTEDKPIKAEPVEIDQAVFVEKLNTLMERVKTGKVLKHGNVQTIGIYAPSGWGKTEIIKNLGSQNDFNILRLELDKVQQDLLSGFPYLADVEEADENVKEDRIRRARKVVKQAESEILPPHKDKGNWLLFFDEFNRADTEKMAAVMNLLMTGELGGAAASKGSKGVSEQYHLPDKIVIVLAMNTETEENLSDSFHAVKNLDIATLGRIPKIYTGKYTVPGLAATFANRPWKTGTKAEDTHWLETRMAPIIMHYITFLATEKGGLDSKAPFSKVITYAKGRGGGGEKLTNPRLWTQVTDSMYENAIKTWDKMSEEDKQKYKSKAEDLMNDIRGSNKPIIDDRGRVIKEKPPDKVEDYLFGAWFRDGDTQAKLLTKESASFGDEGEDFVNNMIREYRKIAQRGIGDDELLLNYRENRDFIKNNFSQLGFGTEAQLLARIFFVLRGLKNTNAIKRTMRKRGWNVHSGGVITQIFQTLEALYDDLKFNEDDFVGFAHLVENAAKEGHEVFKELHAKMAGKWDNYIEALKKKLKTKSMVEKELEELSAKSKKKEEEPDEEEKEEESLINFLKTTLKEIKD